MNHKKNKGILPHQKFVIRQNEKFSLVTSQWHPVSNCTDLEQVKILGKLDIDMSKQIKDLAQILTKGFIPETYDILGWL